jgi:cytochrome c553
MKRFALCLLIAGLQFPAVGHGADINAGKAKSATCAGCHGTAGIATGPVYPNLAGQQTAYLVKQLRAFRDGTRHDPVMGPMAKPLSDTDIQNLAAYYNSLGH